MRHLLGAGTRLGDWATCLFALAFSLNWHVGGMDIRAVSDTVPGVAPVLSGPCMSVLSADLMEWKHERRLIFLMSPGWAGWFCERCCWSRQLPADARARDAVAKRIEQEFPAHDCEQFAHENWETSASVSP